jgi:hypothetical protein
MRVDNLMTEKQGVHYMSNQTITAPDLKVIARECRFAVHIPTKRSDIPDVHFVKEQVHIQNADGTVEIKPNVKLVSNFTRPFWVTKQSYRNHEQKKEWEDVGKLNKIECTQSELRDTVAKALDKPWSREQLKELSASPFLYGSDIHSASIIKKRYEEQYPNALSGYTTATLDVETDVVFGTFKIIMCTLTFRCKDHIKVYTAVIDSFVHGFAMIQERVDAMMDKYLGEYVKKYDIRSELVICDSEFDIVKKCLDKAHEWKPDWLAIWNMDFDVPKLIAACENAGVDPKDVFCDPIVPKQLRFFRYKQGPKKKVTASGKVIPINPANQWHSAFFPGSFYIIDAMCVYRQIRLAKQEEPSYSLDAILTKELGIRKLKFEAADSYIAIRWHQFMQSEYKIEYIIYNRFDCISMVELEMKIKDLTFTLPSFAGTTVFDRFNSQPKKIADAMHWFLLQNGKVEGTVAPSPKEKVISDDAEGDDDPDVDENGEPAVPEVQTLSLKDWVITLPAHLMTESGLKCIEEDRELATNVYCYVADSDAISSYPSDMSALNVSKETTLRELIGMDEVPEHLFRMQNINLLSGPTNAIEYCTTMFQLPKPEELLQLYLQQNSIPNVHGVLNETKTP